MNFDAGTFQPLRERAPFPLILDTDTYNEIDDQFALIYAIASPETLDLRGVTAAPFSSARCNGPADGMEKSFHEIGRILELTNRTGRIPARRGSPEFLRDAATPVKSEAADFIIAEARKAHERGEKLFISAIAALTNVASALLLAPEIARDVVIVWLGGNQPGQPNPREFNLRGDVAAAQAVFRSPATLIQLPCRDVVSALLTTPDELETLLAGTGKIGQYLKGIFTAFLRETGWDKKVIWDVATIASFTVPEAVQWEIVPRPQPLADCTWQAALENPLKLKRALRIDRDAVFADLFARIRRL